MITIEKGVPMPVENSKKSGITNTLRSMVVGDSFEVSSVNRNFPSSAHATAKLAHIKVAVRKTGPDTYRVWRIEDKK